MLEKFKIKFSSLKDKYQISDIEILCVALSGGADSMALLHALLEVHNKKYLHAVIVNHSLREDSDIESSRISEYLNELKIQHKIYKWDHNGIESNIQEEARKIRYDFLNEYCSKNNIKFILTAHHFDDNLENILIAISRGSSIHRYLIPELSNLNDHHILRPFLDFEKSELIKYLNDNNIKYFEDESNATDKYLRNRVRKIASQLKEISDHKKIQTSFDNINRISNKLKSDLQEATESLLHISNLGYGVLNIQNYKTYDAEIRYSLLSYILKNIGERDQNIRLSSIKIIDQNIIASKISTLNGCKILFDEDKAIFIREFGKKSPSNLNNNLIDNRFEINKDFIKREFIYLDDIKLKTAIKLYPQILEFSNELPTSLKKEILKTVPFLLDLENRGCIDHMYNVRSCVNDIINFRRFEF